MKKEAKSKKNFLGTTLLILASVFGLMAGTLPPHLSLPVASESPTPFDPKVSIVVTAKVYDVNEGKLVLGRNLHAENIQPILISIHNNTPNEYSLCTSSVDLEQVDPKKAASKILYGAIPRMIAFRVASFIFWPIAIPSAMDSIYTYNTHKNLRKNYLSKSLRKEGESISAYSTCHRVVFVPKDKLESEFNIDLIDLASFEKTTLHVSLNSEKVSEKVLG